MLVYGNVKKKTKQGKLNLTEKKNNNNKKTTTLPYLLMH